MNGVKEGGLFAARDHVVLKPQYVQTVLLGYIDQLTEPEGVQGDGRVLDGTLHRVVQHTEVEIHLKLPLLVEVARGTGREADVFGVGFVLQALVPVHEVDEVTFGIVVPGGHSRVALETRAQPAAAHTNTVFTQLEVTLFGDCEGDFLPLLGFTHDLLQSVILMVGGEAEEGVVPPKDFTEPLGIIGWDGHFRNHSLHVPVKAFAVQFFPQLLALKDGADVHGGETVLGGVVVFFIIIHPHFSQANHVSLNDFQ